MIIFLRGLGIFILLTLGLNILLGLAGVLDLGYAMSFAIGAYTAAILTNRYGIVVFPRIDFTIVLLISAAVAALFGALKGATATRLARRLFGGRHSCAWVADCRYHRERRRADRRRRRIKCDTASASLRADSGFAVRTILSRLVLCPARRARQRTIDCIPHGPRLDRFL